MSKNLINSLCKWTFGTGSVLLTRLVLFCSQERGTIEKMSDFAEYILNEKDLISKIEIIYFLAPKLKINFDKSVVFKTEIARMFLKYTNIDVDNNLV